MLMQQVEDMLVKLETKLRSQQWEERLSWEAVADVVAEVHSEMDDMYITEDGSNV